MISTGLSIRRVRSLPLPPVRWRPQKTGCHLLSLPENSNGKARTRPERDLGALGAAETEDRRPGSDLQAFHEHGFQTNAAGGVVQVVTADEEDVFGPFAEGGNFCGVDLYPVFGQSLRDAVE